MGIEQKRQRERKIWNKVALRGTRLLLIIVSELAGVCTSSTYLGTLPMVCTSSHPTGDYSEELSGRTKLERDLFLININY
jgi:hypothetical protein